MLFKKKKQEITAPYAGREVRASGLGAFARLWEETGTPTFAQKTPYLTHFFQALAGDQSRPDPARHRRAVGNGKTLLGMLEGLNLTGARVRGLAASDLLLLDGGALRAAAGKQTSFVLHLINGELNARRPSSGGNHDAFHSLGTSGFFQLFARNAQEFIDFSVLATAIAESALVPGMVAADSVSVFEPEVALHVPVEPFIRRFLGREDDLIETPTPAQRMLFGERRRRVPEWLNIDRPLGLGAVQNAETFLKSSAARQVYFADHLPALAESALREFAELTGRRYARIASAFIEDAEYIVVAQGAISGLLEPVLEYLRATKKAKVGALYPLMFRPFPGDLFSQLLKNKKAVTVLECADQHLAALPLTQEVRTALGRALENGRAVAGALPYPDHAIFDKLDQQPQIYSGRFGLHHNAPTFDELAAAVGNMLPAGPGRREYVLGVRLNQPDRRMPKLERMQQQLRKAYPDLEARSVVGASKPDGADHKQPLPAEEPEAPWTAKAVRHFDDSVYDLERFWDSVGFMYATGNQELLPADPCLASGAVPGRSSAFRTTESQYGTVPELLAENCTGCGLCWTYCPESAMPATIQELSEVLETAKQLAEQEGHTLLQLSRVLRHLAKQAYQILAKDELAQYTTLGGLLDDGFARLVEGLKPREDQRAALQEEFGVIRERIVSYPIVKTDAFFRRPHSAAKGSGKILSIAIDPDACKACGICTAVCPENALADVERETGRVETLRKNLALHRQLPDVPHGKIREFFRDDPAGSTLHLLLNAKSYYASLGGDHTLPGSGVKIGMHLIGAAIEAHLQPRVDVLIARLSDLSEKLESKIQGDVSESLKINDFEAFARKLSRVRENELAEETISKLIGDEEGASPALDRAKVQGATDVLNRLRALLHAYQESDNGDGRARALLAMCYDDSTGSALSPAYPLNPYPFPWLLTDRDAAAGEVIGMCEGVLRKLAETVKTIRAAELYLKDQYLPEKHDGYFRNFSWRDLTAEELQLCPPVILAATARQSDENIFAALTGLAALGLNRMPVKICIFNTFADTAEAGGVPQAASDTAALAWRAHATLEPAVQSLLQLQAFVLQSSIGTPAHLLQGALDGLAWQGPALLHIYAPEPSSDQVPGTGIIERAKLAVDSRTFPIFAYRPDFENEMSLRHNLDLRGNPAPDEDWVETVLEYEGEGGAAATKSQRLTPAVWAATDARFQPQYRFVPQKEWYDGMVPIAEYLASPPGERQGLDPYIEFVDENKHIQRMVLSAEAAAFVENRLAVWRLLRQLATLDTSRPEYLAEKVREELQAGFEQEKSTLIQEYDAKLAALQQEHDRIYQEKITRKLLALSGFARDADKLKLSLMAFLKARSGSNGSSE